MLEIYTFNIKKCNKYSKRRINLRKEKIEKLKQFSTLTDYEIDESWKRKYGGCWSWRLSSDFLGFEGI